MSIFERNQPVYDTIVRYNSTLQLHFESEDALDRDDVAVPIISSLHDALHSEQDNASKFRMLLALGHCVYFMGFEAVMLLNALEFDQSKFNNPINVAEVAADIQSILAAEH